MDTKILISKNNIDELRESARNAHRNIWSRFMSPDHIVYDYVGLHGEIILPTPEECSVNKPNALGWWTPIEDGGFFSGAYLLGQCCRYGFEKSDQLREEIRMLVSGLYKLQDVCAAQGMIARGIGSDGKCHYPASSNDQVIPWILGLWKYMKTDIPSESERKECHERLYCHIRALQATNWTIPGEAPGFNRGSFLHVDGLEGSLSSVHFAITTKILSELSGGSEDSLHSLCLTEPLTNGKTRAQIIGEGFPLYKPWHGWFTSTSQYAVRELYRTAADPSLQTRYLDGLRTTGAIAAKSISRYKDYIPGKKRDFTPDWHVMLTAWKEQHSCEDAQNIAMEQIKIWDKANPAVHEDKSTLMCAIPAAWITMMSEDPELIESQLPEILTAIMHFDYDNIHYGALLYVENLVYEILSKTRLD